MAVARFYRLKSLCDLVIPSVRLKVVRSYQKASTNLPNCVSHDTIRPLYNFLDSSTSSRKGQLLRSNGIASSRFVHSDSSVDTGSYQRKSVHPYFLKSSVFPLTSSRKFVSLSPMFGNRLYSSSSFNKPQDTTVSVSSGPNGVDVGSGSGGGELVDKVKDVWHTVVDAANYSGHKATEVTNELTPYVNQLLDSHPYLKDVVVPVGLTIGATAFVWMVMPRLLRKLYNSAMKGAVGALTFGGQPVPFEKSIWGAVDHPARYLVTFLAFSQIGMMVAPTTIAFHIGETWKGAVILSSVWFLHRWKTNLFARALIAQSSTRIDRQTLLTMDKVSSVGLFAIGAMTLAEACGVPVQSIMTVGGIGGLATAYASKDILGNVLSGLSMQFSNPFSLGDTIKAGSIEGQVMEMGLTTTKLLNSEKFPVMVPNSLFSSQVIINKSRAQWRSLLTKIPVQVDDLDKIPVISDEIKSMLHSNTRVYLEKEVPYCFLSRIESTFAELTVGCNLKHMKRDELYATQQDLLLQSVEIIKKHGAKLGSTWQDPSIA